MKKQYDLVFGLGPACSCSQTLRKAGLQHLSFPYDWIGPHTDLYDVDVSRRTDQICNEFAGWFDPADFEPAGSSDQSGKDHYFNSELKLIFLHDFIKGSSFQEAFPAVQAKYQRRIARLLELIRASKNVLLVRVDRPDVPSRTPFEECRYARKRLGEKFAPTAFDMVVLSHESGRPFADMKVDQPEEGLTRLSFDYDDTTPGAPSYQPIFELTAKALSDRFTVRDYRTPEEIAAHAAPRPFWHRLLGLR